MNRVHVAHIINGLSAGGAETMLVTNLRHLDRQRFRHSVVAVHETTEARTFWRSELEGLGIPVLGLGATTRVELALAGVRLAHWARVEGVHVMHAHLLNAMMVARIGAGMSRRPLVTTLHSLSYEPEILAEFADPTSRKHDVARVAEGLLHRWVDTLVIAVGETVAQSAMRRMHVPRQKIRIIPNPIDLSRGSTTPSHDRARIRDQLGLSTDTPLLLHVGRVVPLKGHLDVIEALGQLAAAGIAAHFAIVGPTPDPTWKERLQSRAQALGVAARVHWVGATREIGPWHAASDVFVFPSRYEGLPIALVEALAAGLPAVASDIDSNREVLDFARCGAVFPPGQSVRLASQLLGVIEALEQRRAEASAAVPRIIERYEPRRVAAEHERVYEALGR